MDNTEFKQRERRKFPRRDVQSKIKLHLEDGRIHEALLLDISATGSRISNVSDLNRLRKNNIIAELNIPEIGILEKVKANLAWTKENQIGLSFEEDFQKDKITSFVLDKPNNIKSFTYEHTVYLKDTNAFGNTYFANYFVWQGMAREAFLKFLLVDPTPLMTSGIKMITVRAHTEYYHETVCYDDVLIKAHSENMKRCTFDLIFNFYNKRTSQLIAKGYQTIAFANANGYLTRTPPPLYATLKEYEYIKN